MMGSLNRLTLLVFLVAPIYGCGSIIASSGAGPIDENPGSRTLAQRITDESIETKAKINISAAYEGLDSSHVSCISYNSALLLVGQVPSEAMKALATEIVQRIDGVLRIYNELEIGPETTVRRRAEDTWISTKTKTNLLANSDTPGRRVKVVTENGVVYLMGLVSEEEAARIALIASEVSGTKRVVKLFELIHSPTT